LLSKLESILNSNAIKQKFPNLTTSQPGSVTINYGRRGKKIFKSSAKVLKIKYAQKTYAVLFKPISEPNFSLKPQKFNLTGTNIIDKQGTYVTDVIGAILAHGDEFNEYMFSLMSIVENIADEKNVTENKNITLKSNYYEDLTEVFMDDVSRLVISAINKQFAEVVGPILVGKYLQSTLTNARTKKISFSFPQSQTHAFDFEMNVGEDKFLFSVKSGASGAVNTIKPQFLMEKIKKNETKLNKKFDEEIKLLKQIDSRSIVDGIAYIENEWIPEQKKKPGNTKNDTLKTLTEKMKFNELYLAVYGTEISFFKMNFMPATKTLNYQILMDEPLKELLSEGKRLYLRNQGTKARIGLTPP
jgi:hypothetical protein